MKKEYKRNTLLTAGALLSLAILTGGNEGKVDLDTVETIKSYSYDNNKSISLVNDLLNKQLPSPPIKEVEEVEVVEEVKVVEPIKEVIKEVKEEASSNDLGTFNVSWYTAKCDGCTGITAKGQDVSNITTYKGYKVAASDWNVIPPYSIIEVEGYGQFIVIDRGGAIRGSKLDLLVSTKKEAYSNGRQYLNVKVIKWGDR